MIVTFYSYKGGVGRSMALVNVGEILAEVGYKVVLCDFDLEAPGLERYVVDGSEQTASLRSELGVVDLLEEYRAALASPTTSAKSPEGLEFSNVNGLSLRRPTTCAKAVISGSTQRLGSLHLLSAGRREGVASERYAEIVQRFDWSDFYSRWAGAAYFDYFRSDLIEGQTIVLVDSRTGVTELGGVCTHHLADLVVLLSGPNDINIEGTLWMLRSLSSLEPGLRQGRPLQTLPVPARVETTSQVRELGVIRRRFEEEFAYRVPAAVGDGQAFIRDAEIPYVPLFALTERIVARDAGSRHRELYGAYETLAKAIVRIGMSQELIAPPQRKEFAPPVLGHGAKTVESMLESHRRWLVSDGTTGSRAVLTKRDLRREELRGVSLRRAELTGVNLEQADLRNADLREATLVDAVLRTAKLDQTNLSGADLQRASLTQAELSQATLDFCNLDDTDCTGANFAGATLRAASLRRARLGRATMANCDLREADLTDAVLVGTEFAGANLLGVEGVWRGSATLQEAVVEPSTILNERPRTDRDTASELVDDQIVPLRTQRAFPAMFDDFRLLENALLPAYRSAKKLTDKQLSARKRRSAILGALTLVLVTTSLSIVALSIVRPTIWTSAATATTSSGVLAAVFALIAVALPLAIRDVGENDEAEIVDLLKREYFLFLAHAGPYTDSSVRTERLQERVSTIVAGAGT